MLKGRCMDVFEILKQEIMQDNEKYLKESEDGYDYWENHIKHVVNESVKLAKEYGADIEIVKISALLHDVAQIKKIGPKEGHNVRGAEIAEQMLLKLNYPQDKIERIKGCILHHSKSKYAENIEELCVADADVLAHFNGADLIYSTLQERGLTLDETKKWFYKDFNDLSDRTKAWFKPQFENLIAKFFGLSCE